jgi:hypothetical protein
MGDLIGSEKRRAAAHDALNWAVDAANIRFASAIASPLTITLGDEFQGLLSSYAAAVRAVRFIRYGLLSRDINCRFALGAVRLETPLNVEKAWNMAGEGLAATREALMQKSEGATYRFLLPADENVEALVNALAHAIAYIEAQWSSRQRAFVLEELFNDARSVADVAVALGVSRSVAYKLRRAARLDDYLEYWATLELALSRFDQRLGLAS